MEKGKRSNHIHGCLRRQMASHMGISPRQVRYCGECFTWHNGSLPEFEAHCASHIPEMTNLHYEIINYRHTVIRFGYCVECLWNENIPASTRMRPWSRSWELRKHINDHIRFRKWPAKCPDPHCSHESIDEQAYRHHLHDTHRYNKTIWSTVDENKKRPSPESSEALKAESRPHVPSVKPPKHHKTKPSAATSKEPNIILWDPQAAKRATVTPTRSTTASSSEVSAIPSTQETAKPSVGPLPSDSSLYQHGSDDTPELVYSSINSSQSSTTTASPDCIPIDPEILENNAKRWELSGSMDGKLEHASDIQKSQFQPLSENCLMAPPEPDSWDETALCQREVAFNERFQPVSLPADGTVYRSPIDERLAVDNNNAYGSPDKGPPDEKISTATHLDGPMTRGKARQQANKSRQPKRTVMSYKTRQDANLYTQREDQLLRSLVKQQLAEREAVRTFQQEFPDKSMSSVKARWRRIQPSSPRVTRSQSCRQYQKTT